MTANSPWFDVPKYNYSNKKVIVIGGGLAGTSTAYSFAKRDWQVTLIDRADGLASGASGNLAGILSPLLSHKTDLLGRFYNLGFSYATAHLENIAVNFDRCGLLEFSANKVNSKHNICDLTSCKIEKVSADCASDLSGVEVKSDALYLPQSGFVSPLNVCKANIAQCGENIKVIYSTEVININKNNDSWQVEGENGIIESAPVIVVANSYYALNFKQTCDLPIAPIAGQITYLENSEINPKTILCYDAGYITPAIKGVNYLGATYRKNSCDDNINALDDSENISNLQSLVGGFEYKVSGSRAAIRCVSHDRRPIVGMLPDKQKFEKDYGDLPHGKNKKYPSGSYLKGLYVNIAHGSRGLTSAPICSEIVASMANCDNSTAEKEIIDLISPARFIIREIKRRKC